MNELVMGSGECSELIRRYIREEEGRERARRGSGGGRGSGVRVAGSTAANKSAAILPPPRAPVTPTVMKMRETRGSAPGAAALRSELGEERGSQLKEFARCFQRGEVDAESFYEHAKYLCDGDAGKVMALASHLPDEARRAELLAAHAERLAM